MADNTTSSASSAPPAAGNGSAPDNDRGSNGQGFRGRGGGRGRGRGSNRPQRGRGGARPSGPNPRGADRKRDVGRQEHTRNQKEKRNNGRDDWHAPKRQKVEGGAAKDSPFTQEEIEGEARKPKRKVAVLIGYAGTGYKGMQINSLEKTIEGDIFKALVAAGAISKANADDPKKSSLVRCARTDKGVHAAGNVISLKLIVEDPNTVQNINEHLPPQIRVWGIERTNGSFSCYTTCDSRWYEYLIPTYSFLPPHPQSFLGKALVESAEKEGVLENFKARQADVANFWEEAEKNYVQPVLDKLSPEMQAAVMADIMKGGDIPVERSAGKANKQKEKSEPTTDSAETSNAEPKVEGSNDTTAANSEPVSGQEETSLEVTTETPDVKATDTLTDKNGTVESTVADTTPTAELNDQASTSMHIENSTEVETKEERKPTVEDEIESVIIKTARSEGDSENPKSILSPFDVAVKEVKAAIIAAKQAYRISASRQKAVQDALSVYIGTRNFHNYTIQKSFKDPSAKRVIRSFKVHPDPIIINNTEWLSLKVHGQSFMMHQIRKMIAMAALVVRCGSATNIMYESYESGKISIPKAPSLGLLLERPVFETYNSRAEKEYGKEKIDFDKFETEMNEFKQREIYDRIFREENKDHQFHTFFNHIDHYRSDYFLWITASGVAASKQSKAAAVLDDASDDDEADANGQEG
ncbi:tRNA pseudouridine synthase [Phlyctema vagabunda]|uniref:tRNA pseudouridine synthase n=1 Tax=Phlyctema vagabunda TaxID=108571 RepID=A0ABR4PNS1_9HELO